MLGPDCSPLSRSRCILIGAILINVNAICEQIIRRQYTVFSWMKKGLNSVVKCVMRVMNAHCFDVFPHCLQVLPLYLHKATFDALV